MNYKYLHCKYYITPDRQPAEMPSRTPDLKIILMNLKKHYKTSTKTAAC